MDDDGGYGFPFLFPAFPWFDDPGQTVLGRGTAGTLVTTTAAAAAANIRCILLAVGLFRRRLFRVLLTGTAAANTPTTSATTIATVLDSLY